uniref:FLYWCH-type domain-containing protein n=1 Tax=Ditylenchus dipsaci TaxID=166011 RepID=A0A915E667_9BILA
MCFQDVISTVKSEKGNDMATHRGFRFMKHQKSGDGTKQYWKCDKTYGGNGAKCKARLHTLVAQKILGDSGADGEDSERERNINWSAEMQVIYMDGTFSITPEPFAQVYVILAERSARVDNGGKWVFPVLYALLKNKSRTTYLKLFRMIRNLWPDFVQRPSQLISSWLPFKHCKKHFLVSLCFL